MATTFRGGNISEENIVREDGRTDLERSMGQSGTRGRTVNQIDNDPRGGFGPPVKIDSGSGGIAGTLTFQEFANVTGRTDTNPYGKQGFFSRVLGIDPSNVRYDNSMSQQQINNVNALSYDRYMRPAASTNIFGDQVGGDPTTGQIRYGVQPGDLTRFGRAVPARREGIAGVLDNLPFGIGLASRMFGSTPARVPGFDVQEVVPQLGLGGPQPGMGVDPVSRSPQGPFPTDETISAGQDAAATAFRDMAPVPSVEELIAAAYDESPTSVQNLPAGTDGSATMTKTSGGPRPRQTMSSIPTGNEVILDRVAQNQMRINEAMAELRAGTAAFPEAPYGL